MTGNAIYIQSGGPTAVINASAYGVADECKKSEKTDKLYATEHGVVGLITGKIFELNAQRISNIDQLKTTPGMIFGSCRYEIDEEDQEKKDYKKILENLKKLNIRYIFINGGNGSVRAGIRLSEYLRSVGYDFRLIVIPKTVDNDISEIDHAPGFPSAARHVAITTAELCEDMGTYDTPLIMFAEVMGRNTGFLAAASAVASKIHKGPDLIYFPERVFDREKFISDIKKVIEKKNKCFAVVAEGLKTKDGKYLFEETTINKGMDPKKNMGGVTPYLSWLLRENFSCKIRGIDMGLMQRCSAYDVSETDRAEAEMLARMAVKAASDGMTEVMVSIKRYNKEGYEPYIEYIPISKVGQKDNILADIYINEEGNYINDSFYDYIMPLIGELPSYAKLNREYVDLCSL